MVNQLDARTLKARLHDGGEIAVLDAREEVPFDARHLLMAACVPLSRMEMMVDDLVPRRSTRVVWCDDGEGLAERAASRMAALGYTDMAVPDRWNRGLGSRRVSALQRRACPQQGIRRGCRARSRHAVDHSRAAEGAARQRGRYALFDSRSYEEYHDNSIPRRDQRSRGGTALPLRRPCAVAGHHGGRQLRRPHAQHHRRTVADRRGCAQQGGIAADGTQAWHLSGLQVLKGATAQPPAVSDTGRAAARAAAAGVARRSGIGTIDAATLQRWRDRDRALPVCVRRAHAGRTCGRARAGHEAHRRRATGAGDRPARRHVGRAHRAGGRRRRPRDDDSALDANRLAGTSR